MKIIEVDNDLPIYSWCETPEKEAVDQAKNLARLPFAFHHVALMPDTHTGYGMPIGGVLATRDVIIPNAVGVDIGCGMCAVRTDIRREEIAGEPLKKILGELRRRIPVGFKHHEEPCDEADMPLLTGLDAIVTQEYERARYQLGTLGGGNHFLEIQYDDAGFVWIMIHSGSRNLGKQVADFYNTAAMKINALYFSSVPKSWQLAFLPVESNLGESYLSEMHYCVEFAKRNRFAMMQETLDTLEHGLSRKVLHEDIINIAHNYAALEMHFGSAVYVHRKGATKVVPGAFGIIPGSQGTYSYIVSGKGSRDAFSSCSHGAGRRMGRMEARRNLDLKVETERLEALGVLHAIRGKDDLDEAAGAYKDIDVVMNEQKDLVDITVRLLPMAVMKG